MFRSQPFLLYNHPISQSMSTYFFYIITSLYVIVFSTLVLVHCCYSKYIELLFMINPGNKYWNEKVQNWNEIIHWPIDFETIQSYGNNIHKCVASFSNQTEKNFFSKLSWMHFLIEDTVILKKKIQISQINEMVRKISQFIRKPLFWDMSV